MAVNLSEQKSKAGWFSLGLPRTNQAIIWISAITILALCLINMLGWFFNPAPFKSFLSYWESMRLLTAVWLITTTLSLILIHLKIQPFISKILPVMLAIITFLASLITIYIYVYLMITGNESYLTEKSYFAFFVAPFSRMAFLTAITFFLTSCIIFLLSADNKKASGIAHALIIPVILISYFTIAGYILDAHTATEIKNVAVTLNVGIAFTCIGAIVLVMKPDTCLLRY